MFVIKLINEIILFSPLSFVFDVGPGVGYDAWARTYLSRTRSIYIYQIGLFLRRRWCVIACVRVSEFLRGSFSVRLYCF